MRTLNEVNVLGAIRTRDLLLRRQPLYPKLSYENAPQEFSKREKKLKSLGK